MVYHLHIGLFPGATRCWRLALLNPTTTQQRINNALRTARYSPRDATIRRLRRLLHRISVLRYAARARAARARPRACSCQRAAAALPACRIDVHTAIPPFQRCTRRTCSAAQADNVLPWHERIAARSILFCVLLFCAGHAALPAYCLARNISPAAPR